MIFRLWKTYRLVKKGVHNPTGTAVEEINDALVGVFLLPGIILAAILVAVGILGWTDWIFQASGIARVFFWILFGLGAIYGFLAGMIMSGIGKILRKGEHAVRPHVNTLRSRIDGSL